MSSEFDEVKKLNIEDTTDEEISLADADNMTDLQLDRLYKRLEFKLKRAELGLKLDEAARHKAVREQKISDFNEKMKSLKKFISDREAIQNTCNHKKGARGVDGVMRRQGTDAMYSIIRHVLPDGSFFVICQNCHKEWTKTHKDYRLAAFDWPTDNATSGSTRFVFERNGDLVCL